MKRPIFFILLFIFITNFNLCALHCKCEAYETKNIEIIVNDNDLETMDITIENKSIFSDSYSMSEMVNFLEKMGFLQSQIINYIDPEIGVKIEKIINSVEIEEKDSFVDVSNGYAKIQKEQNGVRVDKEQFINQIINNLKNTKEGKIKLETKLVVPEYTQELTQNLVNLKSRFTTYIYGLNQEGRIQNIKQATNKFNGMILRPGEKLSFNEVIGETTAENGYALAKVIINGKYEEDYGGGVCQVASTLYNSALLAGLKIDRVAPHSLKVGYVAGSFDAMVSAGVSDLIITNPLETPIYIYSYATDAECGFKIFGEKNQFEIVRRTEVIEIEEDEAEKIAFKSEGFLDYYRDGELVKSERIRKDNYKKSI